MREAQVRWSHLQSSLAYNSLATIVGATGANADSSRSHAIFQIVLKHKTKSKKVAGENEWMLTVVIFF